MKKKVKGPEKKVDRPGHPDEVTETEYFYVRLPPHEIEGELKVSPKGEVSSEALKKLPSPYVWIYDYPEGMDPDVFVSLEIYLKLFHEGTHPGIQAIEAFLTAHKAGLHPPVWVLNYLAEIFKNFTKRPDGSLNVLFGFVNARGQDPAFKEELIERRNYYLCYTVRLIKHLFNYSTDNAAHMVVEREKTLPNVWKHGTFSCKVPAKRTLENLYDKLPENIKAKWDNHIALMIKHGHWDTQDKKKAFLKSFPEHSLPGTGRGNIRSR